ncbi:hypothetical protein GE21DRAFT_9662 [Neurospora crassa]|uniref:Uncharacterized protein n=1 Tax=Neurospora crassa (strain ATCC 24698 / 74-OR23-1A / CBS 708.71 / DSM 1257 / FGSC 987) TaxID=367110 RepID=Q7S1N1_NEUCR|nr:hypothetical protein NCU09276 [Neurospora crassa OR74A]EAA29259.1 hypothetical protein NCU09276 [Neurospora crassa OR74A]KHE80373.1 hypothetical protein GE21DRAFT_9662 [Neurospora crassa]|eukprot:XP_958495.1 hypothetical protein NCU09276 [Neurospora crassa OR74A]
MSSSAVPINVQQSLAHDEQPVDNFNSMPRTTSNPNTPNTVPPTPTRAASSSSPPVTPQSDFKYSTNPCTHRALVSSPIPATPKRPYGPFNPSPAVSPNSALSTPAISPIPPSQSTWVPLVMPWDRPDRNHWPRPGWTPAPVLGPPTPPGMTPSEQEDFENNRIWRIWQAVLRDEQEYHRWQYHVLVRRMRREQGLARIQQNERRIQELLAAQQEAYERPVKAPIAASASISAPALVASSSTPASINCHCSKKSASTLSREMKSLAQLGGAGNTICPYQRKRDPDYDEEEDADLNAQTSGTRVRNAPMREDTMPGVWAGRLRPRVVKKQYKSSDRRGSSGSKLGGCRKGKDRK